MYYASFSEISLNVVVSFKNKLIQVFSIRGVYHYISFREKVFFKESLQYPFFFKFYDSKTKILQHGRYEDLLHSSYCEITKAITCRGHGQSQGYSHCPGIPAEAPPGQHDNEDQVLVPCTNLVGTSPTSAKSILILFASPPRGNPLISFTAVVAASMLSYWIVAHPSSTL